jgi:nucleotide-binding universal stress UspA family protein
MDTPKPQPHLKVLLAIDGSEHAWAAVSLLCDLPAGAPHGIESQVRVLAVLSPQEAASHAQRQAVLERASEALQTAGLQAVTELHVGSPAETLVEYASQVQPDLILMGAKGLRATLGILLGGVAQQVVEYAGFPVMVVRAPYQGLRQVLFATDGSVPSQGAMKYLARFPLPDEVELHLVHVLPPEPVPEVVLAAWPVGVELIPPLPAPEREEQSPRNAEEERHGRLLLEHSRKTFAQLRAEAFPNRSNEPRTVPALLRGDAATEILAYAKSHQVDLIVAGSRGLSPIRRWLLGSVSRKLVHYAPCSVLIVHAAKTNRAAR